MHRKPPDLRRAPPGEGVKNKDVKCSACDMIIKNGNIGYHRKHKCQPKPDPIDRVVDGISYTRKELINAYGWAASRGDTAECKKLMPERH